jgi:hypothetical protein
MEYDPREGENMSKRSFASKDVLDADLSVVAIGEARHGHGRADGGAQLWWDASNGSLRVANAPSWRVPPLWETPAGADEEVMPDRVMLRGFPAYKRPWRQLPLF